jgi:hypothetical protein
MNLLLRVIGVKPDRQGFFRRLRTWYVRALSLDQMDHGQHLAASLLFYSLTPVHTPSGSFKRDVSSRESHMRPQYEGPAGGSCCVRCLRVSTSTLSFDLASMGIWQVGKAGCIPLSQLTPTRLEKVAE